MKPCKCGASDPKQFYWSRNGERRFRCRRCDSIAMIARFRALKAEAVTYKGGKCQECGYSKNQAALVFHHLDPTQKDPEWNIMKSRKFDKIKSELDKCILLCCRCHTEVHFPNE